MTPEQFLGSIRESLRLAADFRAAWKTICEIDFEGLSDASTGEGTQEEIVALHLRSIAAEVADYLGHYGSAREFVGPSGAACHDRLTAWQKTNFRDANPKYLLQNVWLCLQWGMTEYRASRYSDALSIFLCCENVSSAQAFIEANPGRHGVRARALYAQGIAHREQYELTQAKRCFTRSAQWGYSSTLGVENTATGSKVQNSSTQVDSNDKSNDQLIDRSRSSMAAIAAAMCLGLGLASVHIMEGRPDQALPMLLAAKLLLIPRVMAPGVDEGSSESRFPGELVISTHIDLLRATLSSWCYIEEEGEGFDYSWPPEKSIEEIERCYERFEKLDHGIYKTRAAYYLAKQCIRYVDLLPDDEAHQDKRNEYLNRADRLVDKLPLPEVGDERFGYLSRLLKGNIARLRGDLDGAERLSNNGVQNLSMVKFPLIFLDFLMERGLTKLKKCKYKTATEDFRLGYEHSKARENHSLSALFLLRCSKAHFLAGSIQEGLQCFAEFNRLRNFLVVETGDLARCRQETLELKTTKSTKDYASILDEYTGNIDGVEEQRKLRKALVAWARKRGGLEINDVDAANRLGISRQTLHNWDSN